jgi:two-component system sensor histidine kinase/response regulator
VKPKARFQLTSEATFRQLADGMPQMVWATGPDGDPIYFNQRWFAYTGLTLEESRDSGWQRTLHPEDLPVIVEVWGRARATGESFQTHGRFLRVVDGTYRLHRIWGMPVRDAAGKIAFWFGNHTDVDDYEQLVWGIRQLNATLEERVLERNRQFRDTEEQFRRMVEGVRDYAILMLDPQGRVISWTRAAERIKQYTESEILGRHFSCFYQPEDIACGRPEEILRIATQAGRFEEQGWRVRKDGSRFWAEVLITAMYDDGGTLRGFSKITRDITARKQIEQELRDARQRSEEANHAKSDFLAAMSHEIRTPMNAILGMSDLLSETDLDEDQRQYVEVFRRAGANLLTLINDLLDISKIETGNLELEQTEFALEEVVDQSVELVASRAQAKGLELVPRADPRLAAHFLGDPNRLRQVLINLLGNAIKFTESGEVSLTVRPAPDLTDGIEFAVSDTGMGIPEDKLETIFEKFKQADSSTTRKYGGTGLGLSISRRIVEKMGGRLSVTSQVGEGSSFRFAVALPAAPGRPAQWMNETKELQGQRVLIVDDNATNRLILRETLISWGLRATDLPSVEMALRQLGQMPAGLCPYSLVIVDRRLPGMDGFEAAARIRAMHAELPVIMLTSDHRPGDDLRRRGSPLAGYAVRPVSRADLRRLVVRAINGLRRELGARSSGLLAPLRKPERSLKILVAEDSVDNRHLIQWYLKDCTHEIVFVEDGQGAVEQFRNHDFDLILMDLQMPVMDGLSATRAIRAIERGHGTCKIPIIALSANASAKDVRLSLEAGCHTHLPKPISKLRLLTALEQYADAEPDRSRLEVRDAQVALKIDEAVRELVPGYLAARRAELSQLKDLLSRGDFKRIRHIGHNLKGTGTPYGFPRLTQIGSALQDLAAVSDAEALGRHIGELDEFLMSTG